jgi:hypothetical protein
VIAATLARRNASSVVRHGFTCGGICACHSNTSTIQNEAAVCCAAPICCGPVQSCSICARGVPLPENTWLEMQLAVHLRLCRPQMPWKPSQWPGVLGELSSWVRVQSSNLRKTGKMEAQRCPVYFDGLRQQSVQARRHLHCHGK